MVTKTLASDTHGRFTAAADWYAAAARLHRWMHARDYRGHDPHDALASPLLRRLTLGNRWLAVAWIQLGMRTPPQLRAWLGARAARNAKGIGLVVSACVRLHRASGDAAWHAEAARLVDWLSQNGERVGDTVGWGYPFAWSNRDFHAPAHTPSGVATAFVGHALLDAAEAWHDEHAAALAADAARFVQRRLRRIPTGDGFVFSYTPLDTRAVHNASALSASLLARVGARIADAQMIDDARVAALTSARAQRPDGSWAYGVTARNQWVDSFHTGYLLVALERVRTEIDASELDDTIMRGTAYWRAAFFGGPAVGLAPLSSFPIDQHAVAHAIITARALEHRLAAAHELAARLGAWSLTNMRAADGSFYYRRGRWHTAHARYMRWTQAWMLLALAELAAWSDA